VSKLGVNRVVRGSRFREEAKLAIHECSEGAEERRVFRHTGWRQLDNGKWVFIHAGGAIGADGPTEGVHSQIDGPLALYGLGEPIEDDDLPDAVNEYLTMMLAVAPPEIMLPLMAAVYRAVFGDVDFSMNILGPTGKGKSQVAALGQQHFGSGMDDGHLPGSWSSTDNALEETAFLAKDSLLVIDDFKPQGSHGRNNQMHHKADRVLRGAANGAGRNRMRQDTTLRPPHPSRAMILSTGEEPFRGQSLNARVLTLEIGEGDVDWEALTIAQEHAANGLPADVMASFISFLAADYDDCQTRFLDYTDELIDCARGDAPGSHKQTPGQIGSLAAAWEMFLEFAVHVGALTAKERPEWSVDVWDALVFQAEAQGQRVTEVDPVQRFLGGISSLLATGKAHLVNHDAEDEYPGGRVDGQWGNGQGELLGHVCNDGIYLDSPTAVAAVERLLNGAGEGLGVSERALRRDLHDKGYVLAAEARDTYSDRRNFGGGRKSWLHLRRDALSLTEPDQPDQDDD